MIFGAALIDKVLNGTKTVSRRRLVHRGGRPLRYKAGDMVAVQPGRGEKHVGHIRILSVREEPLGWIDKREALREGFVSAEQFYRYWQRLHNGEADVQEIVAVIEFERGPRCTQCPEVLTGDRRRK